VQIQEDYKKLKNELAQANVAATTTTDTNTNTKVMETMMKMMNTITTTGNAGGGKTPGKWPHAHQPKNNDKEGKRTTYQFNSDTYCWTCGFDLNHISATCRCIKEPENHKKEER